FAPKIIGVDPSWTGEDEFVIYLRQGLYSKLLASYAKNDNDVIMAQHILRFEQDLGADAVFIDGGHGTGLYSLGQTWGRNWRLVWFAEQSADPGCLNKRMEIWKLGRQWLMDGGAIDPADEVLYHDLIGPDLKPRTDGKLQLESKMDMKKRGIPSPNRADALFLTFAQPVVAKIARDIEENMCDDGSYNPYA
ncbi:MAG: terminase, partial [Cohaesibacter sp.]|nr:terminase [Cohaesibacter sp.]